jgi:hypothetical protein
MKTAAMLLIFSVVLLAGCSHNETSVTRGLYYWKSNQTGLSESDVAMLKSLKTEKLYVKFFEVAPHEVFGTAPEAKILLDVYPGEIDTATEIIPTVFIRNEALKNQSQAQIDTLAGNILFLTEKYYCERFSMLKKPYKELQIDCDWTPSTKDNYFRLLKKIKTAGHKTLSCTLRLYPYKYSGIMGVPPVDKATLMCYNLIHPLAYENKNSILETRELEAYLRGVENYPLHLDVALPAFSWTHLYHNKQFTGLSEVTPTDLEGAVRQTSRMWYVFTRDMPIDDHFMKKGDLLKYEAVTPETIRETIALLKEYVTFGENTTISLFHLDGERLKQQRHEDLISYYTDFGS